LINTRWLIPLNKKALNDAVDSLKIDTASIADPHLKSAFTGLINLVEVLASDNEELKIENQQLKNEVNILKGELGKPDIKPKNSKDKNSDTSSEEDAKDTDISSEKERKEGVNDGNGESNGTSENPKKKKRVRQTKLSEVHVDREHLCEIDLSTLPSDAVNKGYTDVVIQDIKIVTDNVKYRRETYYSASLNKTFVAPLPSDVAGKGEFGVGIRSLIPLFKTECHLSESAMLSFFRNFNIHLSSTYISNQWTEKYPFFNQEKSDIVVAGIGSGTYQQIDDTFARVNGANHYTHILCNQYYAAFFTTERKDRLTVLDIFRNFAPREFLYNDYAITLLETFGLPKKNRKKIKIYFDKNKVVDETCFEGWLALVDDLGPTKQRRVREACAIAAYRAQTAITVIDTLICDDAPQFKLLTRALGLCWIHDGRLYKKLNPVLNKNKVILDDFLKQYWHFYHQLKAYKEAPTAIDKEALYTEFDWLFSTHTAYDKLNDRIVKTLAKRAELLEVLENPELPLHNNASELQARKQARARDVSLHTMSEKGTEIKDSMMTIGQTAKILGVNVYEYIRDRVSGEYKLPSLATRIRQKSGQDKAEVFVPS
jgi:hypothetical protein